MPARLCLSFIGAQFVAPGEWKFPYKALPPAPAPRTPPTPHTPPPPHFRGRGESTKLIKRKKTLAKIKKKRRGILDNDLTDGREQGFKGTGRCTCS